MRAHTHTHTYTVPEVTNTVSVQQSSISNKQRATDALMPMEWSTTAEKHSMQTLIHAGSFPTPLQDVSQEPLTPSEDGSGIESLHKAASTSQQNSNYALPATYRLSSIVPSSMKRNSQPTLMSERVTSTAHFSRNFQGI